MWTTRYLKLLTLITSRSCESSEANEVMTKLRKDKSQIIYLQETHLSIEESEMIKRFSYTKSFYNSFRHGCRRDMSVFIPNSVKFECIKEISDKEGR